MSRKRPSYRKAREQYEPEMSSLITIAPENGGLSYLLPSLIETSDNKELQIPKTGMNMLNGIRILVTGMES